MEAPDYYKTLGISKDAKEDQIKSAYRKLARKHHPDLNPNDKEAHKRFQEINEANEVLSDPEKRKKYDQYGKDWKHAEEFERAGQSRREPGGRGFGSSGGFEGYEYSGSGGGDFSDFFESFFGGGGGGDGRRTSGRDVKFRGQDYNAELHLSLQQAAETHKQTITVNGKNIRITIPAGVENGQVIKLKGHGGPGVNGGPNGDLYITFIIEDDPHFKRDGNDLHTTVDLDLYTAILGGEVTIDTLTGKIKLKVKPETQNGTKTRLKGKGFPVYKHEGEFGDLYVTFSIKIPTHLTEKEKELFQELANLQKQAHGK
jgi:curved DNA-binding protein